MSYSWFVIADSNELAEEEEDNYHKEGDSAMQYVDALKASHTIKDFVHKNSLLIVSAFSYFHEELC
jgi:hypothetical protein